MMTSWPYMNLSSRRVRHRGNGPTAVIVEELYLARDSLLLILLLQAESNPNTYGTVLFRVGPSWKTSKHGRRDRQTNRKRNRTEQATNNPGILPLPKQKRAAIDNSWRCQSVYLMYNVYAALQHTRKRVEAGFVLISATSLCHHGGWTGRRWCYTTTAVLLHRQRRHPVRESKGNINKQQ